MKLDQSQDVIRLAYELKVELDDGPVAGVIRFCERKIRTWTRESGREDQKAADLEALVARRLGLVFREVWSDEELDRLIKEFVARGEAVFATLRWELNTETFAALLECNLPPTPAQRYVAVIDCRGDKAHRRFFSKWHEIAHLLTLTRQLELPFFRSCSDRDPLERLMDAIAGQIAFPTNILNPRLQAEGRKSPRLTFGVVERVRLDLSPDASFQATLNACVMRWERPVLLIEAGLGLKAAEKRRVGGPQLSLLGTGPAEPKFRVLRTVSNDPARRIRLRLDNNMLVPTASLIHRVFGEKGIVLPDDSGEFEDLDLWVHSDGRAVGSGRVHLQARPSGARVLALLQR